MEINSLKFRRALIDVLSGGDGEGEELEPSPSDPPPSDAVSDKKKKIGMVIVGAGIVFLLIVLTIMIILHFSEDETERNNETENTGEEITEERGPPLCGESRGLVASSLRGTSSWPTGDHDDISEGCSRLDWNTDARTACINSFEESTEGTFHNCKWNEDNTCSAETDECEPLQAGRSPETLKPFCTSGVWQPWHNLGGSEEMESSQYCWCREGEVGANIKTNNKAVSRCLPSGEHTSNFPEIFNSGQIRDSF